MMAPRCVHRDLARPGVQVPEGCLQDQSGEYVHADNAAYRYRGQDDGGTLVLVLEEDRRADGGARPATAAAPRVVLERTANGFLGRTEARAFTGNGQGCAVSFPTQVVACPREGLTLRTAASAAVNELCQAPAVAPGGAQQDHRLLRKSLAQDGGAG